MSRGMYISIRSLMTAFEHTFTHFVTAPYKHWRPVCTPSLLTSLLHHIYERKSPKVAKWSRLSVKPTFCMHVCLNWLSYPQVIRFQLDSPSKMSKASRGGEALSLLSGQVQVKQERGEDDFVAPVRPPPGRGAGGERRVPCSIQKVPSISDLSDQESSNSLGKENIFTIFENYHGVRMSFTRIWAKISII